ncbi:MAG: glutathione S-transferase family protein [Henriciella sp.]
MTKVKAKQMHVYGCRISYYTGKLETYLRYRSIAYDYSPTVGNEKKLKAGAGVVQMPVVELDDGRWMTDTTPVINWLDKQQQGTSIYPDDPELNFIALLIEDYADEWLWRPAMHYRWSYRPDRQYAAESLFNDLIAGNLAIPRLVAINRLKRRQLGNFVKGDGVTLTTRWHVEQSYLTALDQLQTIFADRQFILGDRPTIADFGMMAPMLRHFSQDPTPAEIMRNRAPAVYEWVARMWNVQPDRHGSSLITEIDGPLSALLHEISETHLQQHANNAMAYRNGQTHFDQRIQTCHYRNLPMSRYRVWCLEALQKHWNRLDKNTMARLTAHMTNGAEDILSDKGPGPSSGYDTEDAAPFNRAINVFADGLPPKA